MTIVKVLSVWNDMLFTKSKDIDVIPFIGMSVLTFYWIYILNRYSDLQTTLYCFESGGYHAEKLFYNQQTFLDSVNTCVSDPELINCDLVSLNKEIILNENITSSKMSVDRNITHTLKGAVYRLDKLFIIDKYFITCGNQQIIFDRNVKYIRNGLFIHGSQSVVMKDFKVKDAEILFLIITTFCTILINIRKSPGKKVPVIILSCSSIIFSLAFYGSSLPLFRTTLALSWLSEFIIAFKIDINGYKVVLPVILLVMSIASLMHMFLFDKTKWMRNFKFSFVVSYSLMFGDHIQDLTASIRGDIDWAYMFTIFLPILCISVLTFVILSSTNNPFEFALFGKIK